MSKMTLTDKRPAPVEEVQKSQVVRLLDVFLIGPAILYMASQKKLSKTERGVLTVIGGGTVLYNLYNYMKNKGD